MKINTQYTQQNFKGLTLKQGIEEKLSQKTLEQINNLQKWFDLNSTQNVKIEVKKQNPIIMFLHKVLKIPQYNYYIKISKGWDSFLIKINAKTNADGKIEMKIPAIIKPKIKYLIDKNAYIEYLNKKSSRLKK